MIDIHNHILPGIDDGAKNTQVSIEMAKVALDQGIHTIVATPHHKNGSYTNKKDSILKQVDILKELIIYEDIPLTLLPGQEPRIYEDLVEDLQDGDVLSLNKTKYVHIEFPFESVPRYAEKLLYNLQIAGYTPVIVHPERNKVLKEDPDRMYDFVQKGALSQVTAASVVGKFGKDAQKYTHQLLESNLTHFIASDAHNTIARPYYMADAFQFVQGEFGHELFSVLMENSQLLVENKNINKFEPFRIKKKKF